MSSFYQQSLAIGNTTFSSRLIQGPLAGYSCGPMRERFAAFQNPAYCVSEMMSAHGVVHRDDAQQQRYLHRSPSEGKLAYQLSGKDPEIMAKAAQRLESLGADLIDINCGCPKKKIRKKGAGSALLDKPDLLVTIIESIQAAITIPLTVKIRISTPEKDNALVTCIEGAGADALVIHGRRWTDDYTTPCNYEAIRSLKEAVTIPVIVNGDIQCAQSLEDARIRTGADAFMIARAGCGKPWLYQHLLNGISQPMPLQKRARFFIEHLHALAKLDGEFSAMMQGRSIIRYYLKPEREYLDMTQLYQAKTIAELEQNLQHWLVNFNSNESA